MELKTERLLLKPFNEDVSKMVFSKPDEYIKEYLALKNDEELAIEKDKFIKGLAMFNKSFYYFFLMDTESQKNIGWCGYHTWHKYHRRAEIGYATTDLNFRRKGYMKEALNAILNFGFSELGLYRIEALIAEENEASKRLLLSNNFEYEGRLKGHYNVNGIMEDSLLYALLENKR